MTGKRKPTTGGAAAAADGSRDKRARADSQAVDVAPQEVSVRHESHTHTHTRADKKNIRSTLLSRLPKSLSLSPASRDGTKHATAA